MMIPLELVARVSNRAEVTIRKMIKAGVLHAEKDIYKRGGGFRYLIDVAELEKIDGVVINYEELDRLAGRSVPTSQDEVIRLRAEVVKLSRLLKAVTAPDDRHAAPAEYVALTPKRGLSDRLKQHIDYQAPLSKRAQATLAERHGGKFNTAFKWVIPGSSAKNAEAYLVWLVGHFAQQGIRRFHRCTDLDCPCQLDAFTSHV